MSLPVTIGRYEIQSLLGQGGMGAVYRARDPDLDRIVAIKTVSPHLLASTELRDEYLERFRREARAAGRLSHPHIVSVYDLGFDEATLTPFIVMEYVAGVSLETVLRENPSLPVAQAVEIVVQAASALEEAHRNGVVHRDIKPANIFLDARGRVKVGDFGVARLVGSELTQKGVGLGTPGYAAPEVLRGRVADARSDVFALGVLAYRLLTGTRPFAGPTREGTAIEVFERDAIEPRRLRPEVPEHVSAAVMRALAKVPEQRTPSADALSRELGSHPAATASIAPVTPTGSPRAAPPSKQPTATVTVFTPALHRRRRRTILLGLFGTAVVLVLGALAVVHGLGGRRAPGTIGILPGQPNPSVIAASPRTAPNPAATLVARPADPSRRPAPPEREDTRLPIDVTRPGEVVRDTQRKVEDKLRGKWRRAQGNLRPEEKKKGGEKERGDGKKKKGSEHDRENR